MRSQIDLQRSLPVLLPLAVEWAEGRSSEILRSGRRLSEEEEGIARFVGVSAPERIRILLVPDILRPESPLLVIACAETGMLGPSTVGLTLGHAIYIRSDHAEDRTLLAHELRHVAQVESYGSIAAFLAVYVPQVIDQGYLPAPLEVDARAAADRWADAASGR